MLILAIETSCDDTAVAVVQDGRRVLANVMHSQIAVHRPYGGVLPEVAAREHLHTINPCISAALEKAQLTLPQVDAVAATVGPGLIGSLLVGANVAKTLSLIAEKPFLGVHHLEAHVASNYLESDLAPPFLCLLVSGGHTQLIHVQDYGQHQLLGQTLDDAVGEAYDKVARLMGLPYPGGPELDRLAAQGNANRYSLPTARCQNPWDFSFSGLKTAALRLYETEMARIKPVDADSQKAEQQQMATDLAACFQKAVVDALFEKTCRCATALGCNTVAIAGGVSANRGLRNRFEAHAASHPEFRLAIPPLAYCTDNAAMVGAAAYYHPYTTDWQQDVFSRSA
ncbi:MAG: tRNA (adenosine(37)-N6)-threonylcarbamoyltransferase complex transferase subunit TsaD [Candidatus Melainabacteria bacterium]|nr:tRNA (adenosine(37)-N6)-threonylcarbamoyltransferase complex transferase subunit TsaD [Candidatus Melainabacteria bacterium]